MNFNILKIRLLLFSLLFLTILFLIYKAIVPFGEITYHIKPCDNSFFIQKLKPSDRTAGKCQNIITGDPVYFNLNTQRTFNEGELTISYRRGPTYPAGEVRPLLEIGILADKRKNYRLQPLDNTILDNLKWSIMEKDSIYLLQRENNFNNISDFLDNTPNKNEVLTYYYDLPAEKYLSQNKEDQILLSSQKPANNIKPLRGAYQFYTYNALDGMNFNFNFSDLNINKDADDIKIIIYYDSKPILQKEIKDERGGEEGREKKVIENFNLNLNNIAKGFYKIEVVVNDDIITEKIDTSQQIISFVNRIWLAESLDADLITLYSDTSEVVASTINPNGLQEIIINEDVLNIYKELGDVFICDAFGCAHRKHLSIYAMKYFNKPYGYGHLIKKELNMITK